MESSVVVDFQNVYLKYGSNWIIKGLNLKIHKGAIYSLLGPSGAGKTTVVGMILREIKPDFGEIKWNGLDTRRDFGYMPQSASLFDDLSINELCVYYSFLFGMEGRIPEETKRLLGILNLENISDRRVGKMSGGEQRRISFLIALIHEPHFLLLDEPTASLDCLHSRAIWDYLVTLAEQGTTILLTTHYVQEAVNSRKVGFLRNGVLIADDTTNNFIEKYGTSDVEEIFISLCNSNQQCEEQAITPTSTKCKETKRDFEGDGHFKWCGFRAQLTKNLIWAKHNKLILYSNLLFSTVLSVIFAVAFGGDPIGLKVAVVSSVKTYECPRNDSYYSPLLRCNVPDRFECFIYTRLKEKFVLLDYDNIDTAMADLSSSNIQGILNFQENFTSTLDSFYGDISGFTTDEIDSVIIESSIDQADYIFRNFLKKFISKSVLGLFEDIELYCNTSKTFNFIPIKFADPIYGLADTTVAITGLASYLTAVSFAFPIIFTAPAMLIEKKGGFFKRNLISGLTYLEMVAAHLVIQIPLMLLQDLILFGIFAWIFVFPILGNKLLIFSLMISCNIVGFVIVLVVVELLRNEFAVMILSMALLNVSWMLGGVLWPQIAFPYWLELLCYVIPNVRTSGSMNAVVMKGFPVTNLEVFYAFIETAFWILFSVKCSNFLFKLNKKYFSYLKFYFNRQNLLVNNHCFL